MNHYTQLLQKNKSLLSVNKDFSINIPFSQDVNLLQENDISYTISQNQLFNEERQSCNTYRLNFLVKTLISNVLTNITGPNSLEIFSQQIFTDRSFFDSDNISFAQSIFSNRQEINGIFSYTLPNTGVTLSSACNLINLSPAITDLDLSNNNYQLFITYPFSADTTQYIINSGVKIINLGIQIIGSRNMLEISSSIRHNLQIGDTVRFTGINNYTYKDYNVVSLGDSTGSLQSYIFCVDVGSSLNSLSNLNYNLARFKKIINGIESQYYYRLFKSLTLPGDIIINKLPFANNIYGDASYTVSVTKDIDVSDFVDNLGKPLSNLYLTVIKTDDQVHNVYTPVKLGLVDIPYWQNLTDDLTSNHDNFIGICDIHRIYDENIYALSISSHSYLQTVNMSNTGVNHTLQDTFYGDISEYNSNIVLETNGLANVGFSFNTQNRVNGGIVTYNNLGTTTNTDMGHRMESYFANMHFPIPIRQFSNVVSNGSITADTIPNYAILASGFTDTWTWRDLLDIGFSESNQASTINYPFTNNTHNVFLNYDFTLKRSDPFNLYSLYYSTFPSDIFGGEYDTSSFIASSNNNC